MRIALGLYSVFHELQSDLEWTLERVKELGYEGVEFYGEFTHPPERIRELLNRYELTHCGWHTEWKLLQPETLPATIDYHLKAGTPAVIIPALGGPWEIAHTLEEDSPEVWIKHAEAMNALHIQLREHGLQLGYHTHAHEFATRYGETTPWDLLRRYTDSGIILEVDTGNCAEAGADTPQVLSAIAGRPKLLHCKPFSGKTGLETYIGEDGDMNDWPAILRESEQAGTEWLIVEHESELMYPQLDGARRCLEGLRRFI